MGNCLKFGSDQDTADLSLIHGGSDGNGSSGGSSSSGSGCGHSANREARNRSSRSRRAIHGSGRDPSEDDLLGPPPPYEERAPLTGNDPVFHPTPGVSRLATQLSEDEQVKIAQRIGLIHHLPTGLYDGSKKNRECVICMGDFIFGDPIRFLPCMHIYHTKCIDDWLMRSFTCPSCMEPVDAALLLTYENN